MNAVVFNFQAAETRLLAIEVDSVTLAMVIGGVDLNTAKRRKRYHRPLPGDGNRRLPRTRSICLMAQGLSNDAESVVVISPCH